MKLETYKPNSWWGKLANLKRLTQRATTALILFIMSTFYLSAGTTIETEQPKGNAGISQNYTISNADDNQDEGLDENTNSESTTVEFPADMVSKTLPIIYINTEDNAPIVDKVNQINATFFADCQYFTKYSNVGSEESPAQITIKGRGNASWNWPKKPYKIKFSSKTSVFGLPKNKHYALLALNSGYTDWHAYMASLKLGEMIGFDWTPHMIPVELVLNGSYEGLYFLVESVKIDKNRLNIYEQEDLCEDPELIPYGWLVEIDNYDDDAQITIQETETQKMRITYKTPEELSDAQKEWLTNEFTHINDLIYQSDKTNTEWCDYLDMESFVKYFIVSEIINNTDAYNGSFYIHKDKGEQAKWTAGPLWDLLVESKSNYVLWEHHSYQQVHWMAELVKYKAFTDEFKSQWSKFYPDGLEPIYDYIDEISNTCAEANTVNYNRWPEISSKSTADSKGGAVKRMIKANAEWINQHLNDLEEYATTTSISSLFANRKSAYLTNGLLHLNNAESVRELSVVSLDGRRFTMQVNNTVDLTGLNSGFYIITIVRTDNSKEIIKTVL